MKSIEYFLKLIDVKRNIYEKAELIVQNRKSVDSYQELLNLPPKNIVDNIADYLFESEQKISDWSVQNKKFLNYHRALTPFTFFNSIPIDHYIGRKTKLAFRKDLKVLDLGGGTGHFLSSFFVYPHQIEYFLVDPNVRLLHDHFVRMYPELLEIPIGHIKAYAEDLPFKDGIADLIVSSSAIDHYSDHKRFIGESYRCLKKDGEILISSHLKRTSKGPKVLKGIFETVIRKMHQLKSGVSRDDHTLEFSSPDPIVLELKTHGFSMIEVEVFKQYFYIHARKN